MQTILVVDDDDPIRRLIELELKDEGYQVLTASNAMDALKLVQTEPLDLVILDIRMPGMDGLEALPRILGLKEGLKVILNTAYSQYQESFMSWAADAYIIKSADLTELKAKVKELLGMNLAMERLKGLTTIIMAGGKGERLSPLTRDKAKPAIVFGGMYRIIDFTLSNCLNSGIRRIYVLSQYGSLSLDIHLRVSWDIFRPDLGEYIYSVPPQQITVNRWYRGTADSIYQNLKLLDEERPKHVLILSGDHVYKMDYLAMLDFHLSKGADLTVAAVPAPRQEASAFGILHVDEDHQIIDFLEKPADPPAMPGHPKLSLVSMGVYIFAAETLVRELIADAKDKDSQHDFGRNIIPRMIGKKKVYGYPFTERATGKPAYWRDIGQLDAYFQAHMDLLGEKPVFDLAGNDWPVRSRLSLTMPTRFATRKNPVEISDSLISSGCELHEAQVRRAVLSPGVRVAKGVQIEDAVIWHDVRVGVGAKIRRAIIEDGVMIPPRFKIGYDPKADAIRFPVTEGGVVVVPSNVILDAP